MLTVLQISLILLSAFFSAHGIVALYNKYIKKQRASLCVYATSKEDNPSAADLDIVLTTDAGDPFASLLLEDIRDEVIKYTNRLSPGPRKKKNRKKKRVKKQAQ